MVFDKSAFVKLNNHLETSSYFGGNCPTEEDIQMLKKLPLKLPSHCPHLIRWSQHMLTYSTIDLMKISKISDALVFKNILRNGSNSVGTFTSSRNNIEDKKENVKPEASKLPKITLKVPKGTRDYAPEEMTIRRKVFNVLVDYFQLHGAVEIETPVFELKEVLTGKYGEDSKLIYDLEDQGGEILSMRYDLTVPFARYVAMNKISNIKRYHIARVYRRDNPSVTRGRYREFYQCDFDIAGTYDLMVPDAECIQIIDQSLSKLDLGNFKIKVNHRKILDGVFESCGVAADKFRCVCSAVDKLDKATWDEVRKELIDEKEIDESVADKIGEYVKLSGLENLIDKLKKDPFLCGSKLAQEGLDEMRILFDYCRCLNCDSNLLFDMSLARGLDYYTGVIFEAVLSESGSSDGTVGSIVGGGRYDNLVGMFDAKGRTVPCVGLSFGVERLFTLQQRKLNNQQIKARATKTEVLVASAGKGILKNRLKLLAQLHSNHIAAETSYKNNAKLLNQLQYAEENQIPIVLIIGESELSEGIVKLRLTQSRHETTVKNEQLITAVADTLNKL